MANIIPNFMGKDARVRRTALLSARLPADKNELVQAGHRINKLVQIAEIDPKRQNDLCGLAAMKLLKWVLEEKSSAHSDVVFDRNTISPQILAAELGLSEKRINEILNFARDFTLGGEPYSFELIKPVTLEQSGYLHNGEARKRLNSLMSIAGMTNEQPPPPEKSNTSSFLNLLSLARRAAMGLLP